MKISIKSQLLFLSIAVSAMFASIMLCSCAEDAVTTETAPQESATQSVSETASNDQFPFSLWRATCAVRENENVAISPYGAELALGIVGAGTEGETEREIATVLNKRSTWQEYAAAQRLSLAANDPFVTATALWTQSGQSLLAAFTNTAKDDFGAAVEQVDFAGNPLAAAQRINDWSKTATRGKIPSVLEKVGETTRCIVTSAVYFAADWKKPFNPDATSESTFTLLDGTKIKTPLMSQTSAFRYGENGDVQILEMPYKNAGYAMLLLLPKTSNNFARIEKEMTAEKWGAWMKLLAETSVAVCLPRLTTESDLVLNAALSNLGMRTAWTRDADFSPINGLHDLYLSEVRQKVFVKIDEAGTEAAAATSAIISVKSARPDAKAFYANRPFWYAIVKRDVIENAVIENVTNDATPRVTPVRFLFIGRFVKPEEKPVPAAPAPPTIPAPPARDPSLSGEGGEFM